MEITLTITSSGRSHKLDLAKWLNTAVHAALSGIGLTTAAIAIDPATFNMAQFTNLLKACGVGAFLGILGLLRQSPLVPTAPVIKPDVPQA
jgi:hypothetical protein